MLSDLMQRTLDIPGRGVLFIVPLCLLSTVIDIRAQQSDSIADYYYERPGAEQTTTKNRHNTGRITEKENAAHIPEKMNSDKTGEFTLAEYFY